MSSRFILVRHGETEWNREDRMRGWLDAPLNDRGRAQAEAAGNALTGEKIVAVYTSPLSRAVDTARAVARHHGLEPIPYEPIKDFHFGDWEGKTRSEVKTAWPDLYRIYETDPARFQAPGGESLAGLHARALAGLEALVERHEGETVALASHAVTCQIALLAIQGLGPERYWLVKQGNCAINIFFRDPRGWTLERVNDTCHLANVP
ncbi:MAG: histidine phosphatase family protein [Planctomycetota bacterium]|jgi:broad specificity phosphatase PhoE